MISEAQCLKCLQSKPVDQRLFYTALGYCVHAYAIIDETAGSGAGAQLSTLSLGVPRFGIRAKSV